MKNTPQKRKLQIEMVSARGRLRGALNEAANISDEDDDSIPLRGRPPKNRERTQQTTPSPSSRHAILSPSSRFSTPLKRRKREEEIAASVAGNSQKTPAESFVMKLFDRSLDLFKYTEQTPLYPICRAWMANQPRNPSIRSYRESHSIDSAKRVGKAEEIITKLRNGELQEIHAMPAPKETELSKIPPPEFISEEVLDKDEVDKMKDPTKEELMAKHINKWKRVKTSWVQYTKQYQKRYEKNHLIIQELFKP